MTATRRQAAAGLLGAAGASLLPLHALAQQDAPEPVQAGPDEPATSIDTGRDRYEHMVAPVTINGQGPFQFLLDTGANISCVSHRLLEKLMLTPTDTAQVHTVVGVQSRPSVVLERLQVGARDRKRVQTPALPITGGVDGVLGIDWLKGQRLVLDFKGKNIEITKSKAESSGEGRVVVPARKRLGQLTIVDADLGGSRISAMIDSGAQMTMCNGPLRQLVAQQEARKKVPQISPRNVRLESVAGETFWGEMFYLPFVRLGGLNLGNVPVVYSDVHVFKVWGLADTPALVLGMDLLTQFNAVALDFGRSQVRFDIV